MVMEGRHEQHQGAGVQGQAPESDGRSGAHGEPLVITKNGKPVATLVRYGEQRRTVAGLHAGAIRILGDIVSPLDERWEATQ